MGNQPYDGFVPHVTFLQVGPTQAHRSVLEGGPGVVKLGTAGSKTLVPSNEVDKIAHRQDAAMTTTCKEELRVWAYVMTQYNLKPGLRKFGKQGEAAAVKELTQLHVMDTWRPIHAEKLSRKEKMKALSSLLFLKEKRTGDVKGRAFVNGAPQWRYIAKEDAASPTVSTESTLITDRGSREKICTMLRCSERIRQHRCG